MKGPTGVYCDNQVVAKNTIVPAYTLNKNHNSIKYHVVHEAAGAVILRIGKEDTATNMADPLTKFMSYLRKNELLGKILYDY